MYVVFKMLGFLMRYMYKIVLKKYMKFFVFICVWNYIWLVWIFLLFIEFGMFDIGIIIVMVFIMFFIWFGLYSNGFIVLENIYNV